MSGKKKNRNKVKRTGTAPQGGAAPVVDKTDVLVADPIAELSNGNGEHVSTEAAELPVAGDSIQTEQSQSSVEVGSTNTLNGESSGKDENSVSISAPEVHTDVHTSSEAADPAVSAELGITVDSGAIEVDASIDVGFSHNAEPTAEKAELESNVNQESAAVAVTISSEPSTSDLPVEEEVVHKTHSRKSSSSSSKSSKSSISDAEPVSLENPVSVSTANDEMIDTISINATTESSVDENAVSSSISDSVKSAIFEASLDEPEADSPRSNKSSSSSASSDKKSSAKVEVEVTAPHISVSSTNGHGHAHESSNHAETHARRESPRDHKEERAISEEPKAVAPRERATISRATEEPSRASRRPLSRVSSSSSSSSEASLEEVKRANPSTVEKPKRSPYNPVEPYTYNTSVSDDEDDEETIKATERAVERRSAAKKRANVEKVEQELLDAQETILSLKRRLAKSEGETESAKDETSATREDLDSVKLELDLLKKKYSDMVNFREESESDAKKWRQRADILQGELELGKFTERKLAETAKLLLEARESLESERAKCEGLEAQLKAADHDKEELIHAHQRELASAKRTQEVTVANSQHQIQEEREKANQAIKFVKSKLKAQIRELEILLQDRREDEGESRSDKRRLEREIRRLEEKLEAQASDRAGQARSAESNKRSTDLLKDRVNKLTADKLDLETLVLQEKRKFDALNADFDRATTTIRNLQAQLDASKSTSSSSSRTSRKAPSQNKASSSAAPDGSSSSSSSDSE